MSDTFKATPVCKHGTLISLFCASCEYTQQKQRAEQAERERDELRAVMSEVASMPGHDWLAGQMRLAEALIRESEGGDD